MSEQPSLRGGAKTKRRTTLAPWAQEITERSQELGDVLEHVDTQHRDHVRDLITSAEGLAYERLPTWRWTARLTDWWYGSRVERAWSLLHEAELLLVEYSDERGLEIALDKAVGHALSLPADDPVRRRFEAYVQSLVDAHTNGDKRVVPPVTAPSVTQVPEPAS